MNEDTKRFLRDTKFDDLHEALSATHKPVKAAHKPATLQGIGRIVVTFQRLEKTVIRFIGILANIGDQQTVLSIFAAKVSFGSLMAILSALAIERKIYRNDDLDFLLVKAAKAEGIRNQIIHSLWSSGPRLKASLHRRKGLALTAERYEDGELEKIAEQISKLDTAIDALCFDYIEQCHKDGHTPKGVRYL
jgi:hypothetical protein